MSQDGIQLFAGVLSAIQEARGKLLGEGIDGHDKQDFRLAQMLDEMEASVRYEFALQTRVARHPAQKPLRGAAGVRHAIETSDELSNADTDKDIPF